mgnify:CR=1 FL=1
MDETIIPTPQDIANMIVNLPSRHQKYVIEGVPIDLFVELAYALKNRKIQKKDFTNAIKEGYELWMTQEAEKREKENYLVGFEPGTKKVCNCEYWKGVVVEVVKTEWKSDRHIVHVIHQGVTYAYFKTEWLESA